MPSYKRSRYAKVNERRRKAEWNRRSLGQLGRQRRERQADLNAPIRERGRARTRHGFVPTGYLRSLIGVDAATREDARLLVEAERARVAALRAGASPMEAEERAAVAAARAEESARASGLVPVTAHAREEGAVPVVEHVRSRPWTAEDVARTGFAEDPEAFAARRARMLAERERS